MVKGLEEGVVSTLGETLCFRVVGSGDAELSPAELKKMSPEGSGEHQATVCVY